MKIPSPPPLLLAAAILCAAPAWADEAAQKAVFTVIREEVAQQYSVWLNMQEMEKSKKQELENTFAKWSGKTEKRDSSVPFEPNGPLKLPDSFRDMCWPCNLKTAEKPPRGAVMFSALPDVDAKRTPATFVVQMARTASSLGNLPLPYVGAIRLQTTECNAVADKLTEMFGGKKERWRETVPLARQGIINLAESATALLVKSLSSGITRLQRDLPDGDKPGLAILSGLITISNHLVDMNKDTFEKRWDYLNTGLNDLASRFGPAGR
jgi:hypothetical protein